MHRELRAEVLRISNISAARGREEREREEEREGGRERERGGVGESHKLLKNLEERGEGE